MKKNRYIVLLLLVLLAGITSLNAQKKQQFVTVEVSGSVCDDFGSPLEGVLVMNELGKRSITDIEGKFTLETKVADNLAFEYGGYDRAIVKIEEGKLLETKVQLTQIGHFSPLADVDIPFGKVKAEMSTGSVIRVSGEQIQKHPSGQLLEALTGLIPGLQVSQTSSRPGLEDYDVVYHGNTVQVLIDGLPLTQNISLIEVDEVVFMRGASATAFMGEIGSNGLLNVKTKRGVAGPRKITAQAEFNVGTPTSMVEMQNSYDYAMTINNSLISDGLSPFYDYDALKAYENNTDPIRYPDVDYEDVVYRDIITRNIYSAQVVGGDENTKYFANITYNGMEGMENSVNRRSSNDFKFRSNLDIRLTDFMTMDVGLMGGYKDQRSPSYAAGSTMSNVKSIPSNAFPLMVDDKYIVSNQYGTNLLYEMTEGGYSDKTDRLMSFTLGLDFDLDMITEGLKLNIKGSGDAWNQSELALDNDGDEYTIYYDELADGTDTMIVNQTSKGALELSPSEKGTSVRTRYNFSALLGYTKSFGLHTIDASALAYLYKFSSDDDNKEVFISQSYNMRANYSYDSKYAAELILNYAGTNKLEEANQRQVFPTVGASWIMSNEDFMKDISVIDFFKLRGSWGQQAYLTSFSNYFSTLGNWSRTSSTSLFGTGSSTSKTGIVYKSQTASTGLDWPVKTTANIGFDASMLDNKLSVHMDYFNIKKSGLIVRGNMLDMAGGSAYYAYSNQNEEVGNAVEVGLAYSDKAGELRYTVGASIGYFADKRTQYSEPNYTNEEDIKTGDATDAIYGLVSDGLFATDDEANSASQYLGTIMAGDIRYKDVNGDTEVTSRDLQVIGNTDPRLSYGVNVNLAYKAFSLYLNGAGFAGYDIDLNGNDQYQPSGFDARTAHVYDDLPNGNSPTRLTVLGSDNNYRSSDYWLVSGNYFRLENVELAYTLPAKYTTSFLNTAKLFVRGRNVFVISKFENSDPEDIDGGFTDYPIFSEYSLGFNLSF